MNCNSTVVKCLFIRYFFFFFLLINEINRSLISGRNLTRGEIDVYTYDDYLRLISMVVTIDERKCNLCVKIMAKINIIDVELCPIYNKVTGGL